MSYPEDFEVFIDCMGSELAAIQPSISIVDKILLWNPCNPWTPVPKRRIHTVIFQYMVVFKGQH